MLCADDQAASPDWQLGRQLLSLLGEEWERPEDARRRGLLEIAPVHLPTGVTGDCNHYGWPIAAMVGGTIIVMHRRIPGHNATGAGDPDPTMSYGIVLRSADGGRTW